MSFTDQKKIGFDLGFFSSKNRSNGRCFGLAKFLNWIRTKVGMSLTSSTHLLRKVNGSYVLFFVFENDFAEGLVLDF